MRASFHQLSGKKPRRSIKRTYYPSCFLESQNDGMLPALRVCVIRAKDRKVVILPARLKLGFDIRKDKMSLIREKKGKKT